MGPRVLSLEVISEYKRCGRSNQDIDTEGPKYTYISRSIFWLKPFWLCKYYIKRILKQPIETERKTGTEREAVGNGLGALLFIDFFFFFLFFLILFYFILWRWLSVYRDWRNRRSTRKDKKRIISFFLLLPFPPCSFLFAISPSQFCVFGFDYI
jgi:hypothetical protein